MKKPINSFIEMDGNTVILQNVPKKENAEDLNAFFDQEKNMAHLPTQDNQKLSDDDEQNLLGGGSAENSIMPNQGLLNLSNNSQNENIIVQNTSND